MKTAPQLIGQTFGRLTVIAYDGVRPLAQSKSTKRYTFWLCQCDCGGTKTAAGKFLLNGRNTSCGCAKRGRKPKDRTAELELKAALIASRAAEKTAEKVKREAERRADIAARATARRDKSKLRKLAYHKEWKSKNKDKIKEYEKRYRQHYKRTSSGKMAARRAESKYRAKPRVKVIHNQRKRLRDFIKSTGKRVHLRFGCTPEFMRTHIEKQFKRGMTWDNYGEWHIDHIMPCAQFDLSNQLHADICFNWQNLRPLWAKDNHAKSDTITHPQLPLPIDA